MYISCTSHLSSAYSIPLYPILLFFVKNSPSGLLSPTVSYVYASSANDFYGNYYVYKKEKLSPSTTERASPGIMRGNRNRQRENKN